MSQGPALHYGQMYSLDRYSRARIEEYARIIKSYFPSGGAVLDIGCYTAELFEILPDAFKYTGIDFDDEAMRIAKAKGVCVHKLNFDQETLDIRDKFDAVILAEVLEHLKKPEVMLSQVKQLLKEGGIAVISLPNENTIYHRIMSLLGLGIDMCAFGEFKHLHLPTIRQSQNFLKKYFTILKKIYYINPAGRGSRIEKIGWLFSLIPDFIWHALANLFPGLFARGTIFVCAKDTP